MSSYKTAPNLILRTIAGSHILIAVGSRTLTDRGMTELSETGAFLWEQMTKRAQTPEELAEKLTAEYDVSYEEALDDTQEFCACMLSDQCLELAD